MSRDKYSRAYGLSLAGSGAGALDAHASIRRSLNASSGAAKRAARALDRRLRQPMPKPPRPNFDVDDDSEEVGLFRKRVSR